jgi:hypothetical protein
MTVPFRNTTAPFDLKSSFSFRTTVSLGLLAAGLNLPFVISAATCAAELD